MKKKIALGTVQFGSLYGINNLSGIPNDEEISHIFNIAFQSGVHLLDTAFDYGNAEERIAAFSKNRFKIVTKVPFVQSPQELNAAISSSLVKLNVNAVYGYLFHNADNLIKFPILWESMLELQAENKTKKIGYSLYTPEQLETLLDFEFIPDIVQIPYSLLDRKFEKYLKTLKELGTEIHVRSTFLQGLYFMNPENLPEKLQPLKPTLNYLLALCNKENTSIGSLALNYVINNPNIDQVVMGVDSKAQLLNNLNVVSSWPDNRVSSLIEEIDVPNQELLNPVNWK
jgi:aryl-alcohol dehydrogenase-like predicted oxidoreductase